MKQFVPVLAGLAAAALLLVACAKVPHTDRTQYNLVPDSLMDSLGSQAYFKMLNGQVVVKQGEDLETVVRVAGRIAEAIPGSDGSWDVRLIDDGAADGICLPSGHILLHAGIFPVVRSEAGLAFFVGHVAAHITARHGAERLSQRLELFDGLGGLRQLVSEELPLTLEQQAVLSMSLGAEGHRGAQRPFSRTHDNEADVIAMMYMAKAGYPPDEALAVWDRLDAAAQEEAPPRFLSTHPAQAKREAVMNEWLERAHNRYLRSKRHEASRAVLWEAAS